jgi:hypothetical protein
MQDRLPDYTGIQGLPPRLRVTTGFAGGDFAGVKGDYFLLKK